MTSTRRSHATLAVVFALVAAGAATGGCEIIANFDRSLIPGPNDGAATYDGAFEDVGVPQADTGAPGPDGSKPGAEAGVDSSTTDATSPDAADTSVTDSAAPDATDSSVHDTGTDTGVDTGVDAGEDAGEDASDDAG
jgi:hypothetical protein